MADLIITRTNKVELDKLYALSIRDNNGFETNYSFLCYLDQFTALELPKLGPVEWLFGPIDEEETMTFKDRETHDLHPEVKEAWNKYIILRTLAQKNGK